jgi:hypothetical protein
MSDEAKSRMVARCEQIERSTLNNQFGWFEWLSARSNEARAQALGATLPPTAFEEWQMLTMGMAE